MKVTQPVFWNNWKKNGRRPARPPMRFTECKKLELKNSVSSATSFSKGEWWTASLFETCLNLYFFRFGMQWSDDGNDGLSQTQRF